MGNMVVMCVTCCLGGRQRSSGHLGREGGTQVVKHLPSDLTGQWDCFM